MSRCPNLRNALVAMLALSTMGGLCCPPPEDISHVDRLKSGELTAELAACYESDLECEALCTELLELRGFTTEESYPIFTECRLEVDEGGPKRPIVRMTYTLPIDCVGGRRPAGEVQCPIVAPNAAARALAGVAHLEAISIHAFVELARELAAHDAPSLLISRALAAAADEVAHAGAVARLARERGAQLEVPRVPRTAPRTLVEIAATNAAEGCVRELYGAAVALWQGQHAGDADVRRVFAAIAEDELRHAELAIDVATWISPRLSAAERSVVSSARAGALAELAREAGEEDPILVSALGLPGLADAQAIAHAVSRIALG